MTEFNRVAEDLFEKSLDDVRSLYDSVSARNEFLENENKKLKDEHYKDEELARMKEERDTAVKDLRRGFYITEKENKSINNWINEHCEKVHNAKTTRDKIRLNGVSGGRFSYLFVPTGVGTVGTVKCTCGDTFVFRELM